MASDNHDPSGDESLIRSSPSKKNPGKVPRTIRKAKREKLKRDNMNVLFLELAKTLEPARQNNGKSSTLSDSIRLLRGLLDQVDSLKRENATLLSEYQYITIEKNELKEENSSLDTQVEKLQSNIEERVHCRSASAVGPVFVVPVHGGPDNAEAVSKHQTKVNRPQARYASSLDSWPSHILSEQAQ
ncbi:hypothetical protein LguiA_018485 [Lonicera macranthoides]